MGRELVFRAWSNRENTFLFSLDVGLSKFFEIIDTRLMLPTIAEGMPIEQYVGLKDKYFKKIFESDIVKSNLHDRCKGVIKFDDISARYYIDEIHGGHNIRFYFTNTDLLRHDMEIVGNIHENPELLNKGNHKND